MSDNPKDLARVSQTSDSPDSANSVELGKILSELPPESRNLVFAALAKSHSGPLPDPETLAYYEQVHAGAVREILNGARETRRHRVQMDNKVANTARLSLVLTFVVVIASLLAGVFLGVQGHEALGAIFGTAGLVGVVVAMIRGGGTWTGRR